jgi:hypothetical protein
MLQQTRTIPVVFVIVADPVGSGASACGGKAGFGFPECRGANVGKRLNLL